MPKLSKTNISGLRPKMLLVTSLTESKLNRHIIDAIHVALSSQFDVEYLLPVMLVQKPSLSGYAFLLYIGSSLSEDVPLATMSAMAKLSDVPSVFWATDDPYEFDARYRADGFDIYLSNDGNAAMHFIERSHVYHLPLAAASADKRVIVPVLERKLGAFFCGYHYESRRRIISDLLAAPNFSRNDLVVMGGDWNIPGLQQMPSVETHENLIDAYTAVWFVLNLGRTYDIANSHRKLVATTPGPRTFECALAGTPQVYFCNSLEIEDYYEPDNEILVVESVDEAIERMRWLRKNPDAWRAIAEAAQARTEAEHLYEHRIQKMLSILVEAGFSIGKA